MARWGYLLLISLCLATVAAAADTDAPPAQTGAQPFEIVKQDIDLEAAPDGHYWLSEEIHYRPLTDQGVQALQTMALAYTAGYQRQLITAYTLKKDGTRLDVPPASILNGRGQSSTPGYQDLQTRTVVFPNVAVGDEIVLVTTTEQLVPWFPNVFALDFTFSRAVVVREATVSFTTRDNDSAFKINAAGLEAGATQSLGGKTRRVWHFHNDTAQTPDPDRVSEIDDEPHVEITTLANYNEVAKLYAGIFSDKAKVTPAISALADQVTTGMTDKRAQATALFNWVATHIQYVDIVLGAGGFVPNTADQILKNGYGDCKDHVMLLESLLGAKGIDSSAVLIRAGAPQYRLPAVASPFLFDHLITYVPAFGLYLDSTAKYAPFGVLPLEDSGKSVLVVSSGKTEVTPPVSSSNASVTSDVTLKVNEDGSADGDTVVTASGAMAVALRALMSALPQSDDDNYLRANLGPGSSGQFIRNDPLNLAQTYRFSAHYHVAHIGSFPGPGAFPPQLGYKPFNFTAAVGATLPPSRAENYVCASGDYRETVTVTLPKSVKQLELPASQTITTDGSQLKLSYTETAPDTLHSEIELRQDHSGPVCDPAYYAKVRPALARMASALSAQILYH